MERPPCRTPARPTAHPPRARSPPSWPARTWACARSPGPSRAADIAIHWAHTSEMAGPVPVPAGRRAAADGGRAHPGGGGLGHATSTTTWRGSSRRAARPSASASRRCTTRCRGPWSRPATRYEPAAAGGPAADHVLRRGPRGLAADGPGPPRGTPPRHRGPAEPGRGGLPPGPGAVGAAATGPAGGRPGGAVRPGRRGDRGAARAQAEPERGGARGRRCPALVLRSSAPRGRGSPTAPPPPPPPTPTGRHPPRRLRPRCRSGLRARGRRPAPRDPGDHTIASVAAVLLSLLTGEHQSGTGAARSSALVRLLLGAAAGGRRAAAGRASRWLVVHALPDAGRAPLPRPRRRLRAGRGARVAAGRPGAGRRTGPRARPTANRPRSPAGRWASAPPRPPRTWPSADTQAARALARARATRTAAGPARRTAPASPTWSRHEEAEAHARDAPRPARRHPALTETLRTWLSLHGSWDRTAVALSVHRNTVRQRIARCAALLERGPGRPGRTDGAVVRAAAAGNRVRPVIATSQRSGRQGRAQSSASQWDPCRYPGHPAAPSSSTTL